MRSLWIWILPFFFIPNFGFGQRTAFGTLEVSDFLLIFFIPLILMAPKNTGRTWVQEIQKVGLFFVLWSLVGVLWIYIGFEYMHPMKPLTFCLLKLLKFTLYGFTGVQICKSLNTDELREKMQWAILWSGVVAGFSLIGLHVAGEMTGLGQLIPGFKSTNMISVGLSILLVYVMILFIQNYGSPAWRRAAVFSIMVMLIGSSFTEGRGGWLAAMVAIVWTQSRVKLRRQTLYYAAAFCLLVTAVYMLNVDFQRMVDRTLNPDPRYLATYQMGVAGIDDGGRISTWKHEFSKISKAPIIGAGFYHRGAESGLWLTGSHNFWLQIALETGLVGGTLMICLFFLFWRHASLHTKHDRRLAFALKAALVVTFIGGLSGEYFYGGFGMLTVFFVYAPVGSLSPELMAKKDKSVIDLSSAPDKNQEPMTKSRLQVVNSPSSSVKTV